MRLITYNWLSMVPLVSFLAALRILTEAQSCNNGMGRLVYEKVSDYRLTGSAGFPSKPNTETISRTGLPIKVLEECIRRCQEDKTTNLEHCLSFDFAPGKRRSSPFHKSSSINSISPVPGGIVAEYEESHCTMYSDRGQPDGTDALIKHQSAWHFNEVCLSSNKLSTDCANRLYVFERIPSYRFEGLSDKELTFSNRTECEDACLSATDMPCRSVTFDRTTNKCRLSRETRYMNPRGFKLDPNCDYMENMCLKRNQMCTSTAFILETGKELDGAYERELIAAHDFQECSNYCLNSLEERGFLCRSFIFDDGGRTCILYDEDPLFYGEIGQDPRQMSQPMNKRPLKPSAGNLYRVLCVNTERVSLESGDRGISMNGPYPTNPSAFGPQPQASGPWGPYNHHRSGFGGPHDSGPFGGRYEPGPYGPGGPPGGPPLGPGYGPGSRHPGGFGFGGPPPPPGSEGGFGPPPPPPGGLQAGGSAPHLHHSGPGPMPPPLPFGGPGMGPPPPPSFGTPYHSGPVGSFPPPLSPLGPHPNAIPNGPFGFGPHGFQQDRCQFPNGAPGSVRFQRVGFGTRLRNMYIFKVIRADRQEDCERACVDSRDFTCRSFNYRSFFPAENCELSQYDSKQLKLENPAHFEQHTQFDYYERDSFGPGAMGGGGYPADCLEVSQQCTPEGMEFTVKTPEGFYGRIYTYGFYDSCFYDGNGGTVNVLRISRANGFPRCGTQQYGDAMTNIVVVQFNDYVQTSRDKKYNLTCYFSGPGEAVVTSNYLDAKTDGRYPTQIEHLPAQNILTSNVVLRVLYRGTPTNTIVVGDLLTFRLEARGHYRYDYFNSDIFATNVIAKDPYTGRQVHLIDSRGCPVDLYVFPELHKTPDGALEAEFYAFKIPDSTFLVFQATVRTCRGPCEPVICTDRGRGHGSFPSWGRRKREAIAEGGDDGGDLQAEESLLDERIAAITSDSDDGNNNSTAEDNPEEEVHELFRVYLSRADIPSAAEANAQVQVNEQLAQHQPDGSVAAAVQATICVTTGSYYALVCATTILSSLFVAVILITLALLRRSKFTVSDGAKLFQLSKEAHANLTNPNLYVTSFSGSGNGTNYNNGSQASKLDSFPCKNLKAAPPASSTNVHHHSGTLATAAEPIYSPIYTDPSLFERSRSLRSLTVSALDK